MSDHWDGPGAKGDPIADITDFYICPSEISGERTLVLVLNVYPAAQATTTFDDAVAYNFRVRPVSSIGWVGDTFDIPTLASELTVTCRSVSSESGQLMTMLAQLNEPGQSPREMASAAVPVGEVRDGFADRVRLFAGLRADTSFTDLARVRLPVWRDTSMEPMPGVNALAGHNVLSMVVEIRQDLLPAPVCGSLYAATTESVRHYLEHGEPAQHRIDRLGWPEVNVWLIQDDALRDLWNSDDPFDLPPDHEATYRAELQAGLARLDNFEKSLTDEDVIDWPTPHPMIDVLLRDCLVVDTSRPTTLDSASPGCLEILTAHFHGLEHRSCGGRLPNENVMSPTLTWYINGPSRPAPVRGSGVNAPERPARPDFPFMPEPYPASPSVDKVQLVAQHHSPQHIAQTGGKR